MYEPNKFFLQRQDRPAGLGGTHIEVMTHLPRILSVDDAMTLAAGLIKLAGGLANFRPYAEAAGLVPPESVMRYCQFAAPEEHGGE